MRGLRNTTVAVPLAALRDSYWHIHTKVRNTVVLEERTVLLANRTVLEITNTRKERREGARGGGACDGESEKGQ